MPDRTTMLVAAARIGLVDPRTSTIAARAGVSTETVRHVLAGRHVGAKSRAAVLAAIGLAPPSPGSAETRAA